MTLRHKLSTTARHILLSTLVGLGASMAACDSPGGRAGSAPCPSGMDCSTRPAPDASDGDGAVQETDAIETDVVPDAIETDIVPDVIEQENRAPTILSLSANTATLNANGSLVVTALVTDPDGIDDLIGGQLSDLDSGGTYGAFTTAASEGSYALTVSWDALRAAKIIDAPPTGVPLRLRAEFYDAAGAQTERDLTITLRCDATDAFGLCGGRCTNLQIDKQNCGTCGNVLAGYWDECEDGALGCGGGDGVCGGACVDMDDPAHCGSCEHDCNDGVSDTLTEPTCRSDGACMYNTVGLDSVLAAGATCIEVCLSLGMTCGTGITLDTDLGHWANLPCTYSWPYGEGDGVFGVSCSCKDAGP